MIPGSATPILLPVVAGGGLTIGQAYQGGYYAGTITYPNGAYPSLTETTYNLIVAPKASGEASTAKQYKTSRTADGDPSTETSPSSSWDGYFNTYDSIIGSSSVHPAANYCQNLSTGGYADWYLPATEEAKLAYGNLVNLAAWQTGGSEEFSTGTLIINGASNPFGASYWTSRQDGAGSAALVFPGNGATIGAGFYKTDTSFVRAIRRVTA
jgi:hypothetical protein